MRFTLSYRDVEDLLGERGVDVSDETVRRWVLKFGPFFARELHRRRHLDEMAVMIAGRQFWLWPAVDEGDVLDLLVQWPETKPPNSPREGYTSERDGQESPLVVTSLC
jgi:putative transposase